jgi:hypothetical protein
LNHICFPAAFQQSFSIRFHVAASKNSVPGNQDFSTRANHIGDIVQRDPAVHLDLEAGADSGLDRRQLADLLQARGDELLSAKSGVHGHHEHIIHHVQHFRERPNGSGGIDHYARLQSAVLDVLQSAMQMYTDLLVHGDPICASIGKGRNVLVWILNH